MRRFFMLVPVLAMFLSTSASGQVEGTQCIGEPTDQPIAYGAVITCTISPVGDSDIFRFLANGNERILIQMTGLSGGVDPCIALITPSNGQLSACGAPSARIIATLNEPGMHSIVCSDNPNNETGNYSLVLERLIPPSPGARAINFGETLSDRLDPGGDQDIFTFTATAGSSITLTATASGSGIDPCIDLIAPDSALTNACSSPSTSLSGTLSLTGTYAVVISDGGQNESGNYTLTLQCLSGPCAADQRTVTVPATSPWVDSGVGLTAGQLVAIRATAEWTSDPALPLGGPMGRPQPCSPPACPIHGNLAALVGRIGSNPPFFVGESFSFVAPTSGTLQFMINDDLAALGDNSGSANVYVLYSSPPLSVEPLGWIEPGGLLGPPTPNPFRETSTIHFQLAGPSAVSLRIYDVAGRLVRTFLNSARLEAGEHAVQWDGRDDGGMRQAAGTYFYRLDVGEREQTRRAILLK